MACLPFPFSTLKFRPPSFISNNHTQALSTTNCAKSPTMATGDDSSDLSSLSSLSPAPSEDELEAINDVEETKSKKGIQKYFAKLSGPPNKEPSPPPRKRSPSPPHEYVLADNPDIAVRGYYSAWAVLFAFYKWKCWICSWSRCAPVRRETSRASPTS